MKFFTENRRAALAALIIAVALSAIGGTVRSAGALQRELESVYGNSGAASDMNILTDSASQVASVYKAASGNDEATAEVDALLAEICANKVPTAFHGESVRDLKNRAAVMYNALVASGEMTEAQSITAMRYYYDMLNAWTMLCDNEEYSVTAGKYNKAVSSVPLRFTGMESAAVFG